MIMKYSHIFLAVALSASTCFGVESKECDTSSNVNGDGTAILELQKPDQLEALKGCTILNGDIVIQSGYEGEFVLNDVIETFGHISTVKDGVDGLGLFEMHDLDKIGNINIFGLSGDINLPNLERAGNIELVQMTDTGRINLRSLAEAENVSIQGGWTSTDFTSLEKIAGRTEFCSSQGCGTKYDDKTIFIAVDLPALEKTDYFNIQGTVKSVSLPELEVVGYIESTELFPSQGLRINIAEGHDKELDFDAPKLHTLNGTLEVYGDVSSLSLGSLGETTARVTLNTRASLDMYSTIETAKDFNIRGELNSIYLPNMKDLGGVDLEYNMHSESLLPCNNTLYKLWQTQPSYSSSWEIYNTCKDYDFQDDDEMPKTEQSSTSTSTTTPTSTTNSSNVSKFTNSGTATTTSGSIESTSKSDAENSDASLDNAAHHISTPFASGAVLVTVAIALAFLS